ncbi:PREDICTED: uncharacterized protein LOC18599833 [Theobroma cacao]|uniref:Uncharacterized protein LOC18599833 n=1 Tax=Theobroma cacao TaxID=3641 RepID=A0AB32V5S9_THECC|nr:PREDICTED: uncharacterized protein LOC18599833 [Theobroma cacao]
MQCDEQQETPMLTEEYIEPHCQWTRGKELDRIEITLDGFRKEDVKVTLKHPVGEEEHSIISVTAKSPERLCKKFEIPNDYELGNLRAELCCGSLILELPKKAASNKLEILKPKLEIRKALQESAEDMQKNFFSAVEYFYSKKKVGAFIFMMLASGVFAYKYYTERCGVEN